MNDAQAPSSDGGDFQPTASWDALRLRAELLRRVRRFFDDRGFLEVETPVLSAEAPVDRHLDPLPAVLPADPGRWDSGRRLWLQTSPEAAMKRLMACRGRAIYQVARAFRAGERSRLHNPEFTLVEWYRAGDDYQTGMDLLAELAEQLLEAGPAERVPYRDAFQGRLGLDPLTAAPERLAKAAAAEAGRPVWPAEGGDADRTVWLDLLWAQRVQPHLGRQRPLIVYDFPADQAAMARIRPGAPPVAERFELFYRGLELANGYHELLDAEELAARWRRAAAQRRADGKAPLPGAPRLLAALRRGLPPCAGAALGFDRLVMAVAEADSIDQVVAFPIERA